MTLGCPGPHAHQCQGHVDGTQNFVSSEGPTRRPDIATRSSYAAWGSRQSRHDTVLLSEPRGRRSGGLVEFVIDAHRPDSPVSSCVIWMERCKVLRVAYTVNKGLPGLKEDIRGVMSRKRPSVGFLTNTDEHMAATHIELIFSS